MEPSLVALLSRHGVSSMDVCSALAARGVSTLDDFCAEHDLLLCSDEIHADLLLEPGASHTPAGAHGRWPTAFRAGLRRSRS